MPETPYTETEALLLALRDVDADSGPADATVDYLVENMLPSELTRLRVGCFLLADAAGLARHAVEVRRARGGAK